MSLEQNEKNPYRVTDDEFEPAWEQFHKMVYWQAQQVAFRLSRKHDKDFIEDTAQDIFLSMVRCIEKYKRQKFIVACYGFLKKNPELIPAAHFNKTMCAIWYWQMRAKLGPRHGFKHEHDQYLADAIDAIEEVAPDFSYAPEDVCLQYMDKVESGGKIPKQKQGTVSELFDSFRKAVADGKKRTRIEIGSKINKIAKTFSPYGIKPCRWVPFQMDAEFGPYAKKFIINHGNKTVSRRPAHEHFSTTPIEDFADVIPDNRRCSSNVFYSEQHETIRRSVMRQRDPIMSQAFDILENGDSDGIFNNSINVKGLKRRLHVSESKVRERIEKIRNMYANHGGLDFVEDRSTVHKHLAARTSSKRP